MGTFPVDQGLRQIAIDDIMTYMLAAVPSPSHPLDICIVRERLECEITLVTSNLWLCAVQAFVVYILICGISSCLYL